MHVCGNSFSFSKTFTSVCSHNTAHTKVCSEQIHLQTWRITLLCSHKSFNSLCAQAAPKQMYSRIWKNTFLEFCWNTVCVSCFRRFPACYLHHTTPPPCWQPNFQTSKMIVCSYSNKYVSLKILPFCNTLANREYLKFSVYQSVINIWKRKYLKKINWTGLHFGPSGWSVSFAKKFNINGCCCCCGGCCCCCWWWCRWS